MPELIKVKLELMVLIISSAAYMATLIILLSRKQKAASVKAYIAFVSCCLYWSLGEMLVILIAPSTNL